VIYSLWNQASGQFDYFEDGKEQPVLNVEKPGHLRSRALGSTVDQAAWPLPSGAKFIGRGPDPVGRVASQRSGALGFDGESEGSTAKLALLLLSGFLLLRYVAPRRRP